MSTSSLRLLLSRPSYSVIKSRWYHHKFKRVMTPPLQKPRESPYIVGPHLKPDYMPREYITEPIKSRHDNDLDYFIYEPTKIEPDETRTVSLLLLQDVEGLGVAGQVVNAPYRFGASSLVAMRKADYATEFALNWHKFGPRTILSASSALSPRTARLLTSKVFPLPIKKGTTLEPWHISLALRQSGCICPEGAVEKDSIQEVSGEGDDLRVKCVIRINNHEKVDVTFEYKRIAE